MKLVLVVLDSVRADAVGFGGGPSTATLDALARSGSVFGDHHASGSWTVPSLLSMCTGRWPSTLGAARWRHPLPSVATLPGVLAGAGWESIAAVPMPRWSLANLPGWTRRIPGQDPEAVVAALRAPRGSDRFVLIHHWGTHLPYLPVELPRSRWRRVCEASLEALAADPATVAPKLRALYAAAVQHFDRELLPRYLDAAAAGGDDVLLVVTADHGETWGEAIPDGHTVGDVFDLHGRWMVDATTRVPLLIDGPGIAASRSETTTRGIDLAPTLLDLLGMPGALGDVPGRSLAPATRGEAIVGSTAWTTATQNAIDHGAFVDDGPTTFRRWSVRTRAGRRTWDFVSGDVWSHGDIAAARADALEAWAAEAWQAARTPRPLLGREASQEPSQVGERMRMLGYAP